MKKYFVRENLIKIIRGFFYERHFHEVIPPLLNTSLPFEANLRPFTTTHECNGIQKTFYFAMSPERGVKRMLAQGLGNCFAISKSFRNNERIGSLHNHEFIMLEWYRKSAIYTNIMNDTEKLLWAINERMENKIELLGNFIPRISLNDLFKEKVGQKLETLITNEELFRKIVKEKGYKIEVNTTWEELYNQLFVNEIEHTLSHQPLFLIDFPTRISPFCKKQQTNPHFAERFELYINGVEIGNGNTENTDVTMIRKVFENEHEKTGMPIDEEFLTSLEIMKNDTYAGIGVGIDRLTMLYANTDMFV